MKTIILILAAIATMLFATCLDADGQRPPVPQVYTVADHKKGKAAYVTMTLERDVAFVLSSDTQTNGRYEALIENRPRTG